jgi:shikimate kinase
MAAALASTGSREKPDRSNIALTGFMGAGKSTVGAQLARRLSMDFVDTDRACEQQAGVTIDQLFAEPGGEETFRRLERTKLRGIATARSTVFACGGGALLDEATRKTVSDHAVIVWLWAPLATCLSRLEGQSRPLLRGQSRAGADTLLQQRLPSYAESAELVLSVATRTANEVATELAHEFRVVSGDPRHPDNG